MRESKRWMARFPFAWPACLTCSSYYWLVAAGIWTALPAFQRGLWVLVPDRRWSGSLRSQVGWPHWPPPSQVGRTRSVLKSVVNTTARWTYWSGQGGSIHLGPSGPAQTQLSETLKLGQRLPEAGVSVKPSVSTAGCPQWTPATATAHHGFSLGSWACSGNTAQAHNHVGQCWGEPVWGGPWNWPPRSLSALIP